MNFCRIAGFVFSFLLLAHPSWAERPAQSREQLERTLDDLKQSRQREQELNRKKEKTEEELLALQQDMSRAAADVQEAESQLSAQEEKLAILARQLQQKQGLLALQQKQFAALLRAAMRLGRVSPATALLLPGNFEETLQSAKTLDLLTEAVRQESGSLAGQLRELQEMQEKVAHSRATAARKQAELEEASGRLQKQAAQRRELHLRLTQAHRQEQRRLDELSKKSQSLKELIATLEKQESGGGTRKSRSFAEFKGKIRMPAAGKVVRTFGEQEGRSTSKGMVLETREKAQVLSPFDGEVVFIGPFLDYGKLVILRHTDSFHTLLAGFETIDISNGQFLLEGEPVGTMGSKPSGTRLYMEFRKKNQPIDPAPWVAGL